MKSRSNLATGYRWVVRLPEAVTLYEQTLADMVRVLGADHPDTLKSRSNLALGYQAVGRLAEAVTFDEKTRADRVRVLGSEHPHTLTSLNNLDDARSPQTRGEPVADR